MLEAAAVLGDGFTLDVLAAASGIAPAALMDALDEAPQSGVLREAGDGYRFGPTWSGRPCTRSWRRRRQSHPARRSDRGVSAFERGVSRRWQRTSAWRGHGRPEDGVGLRPARGQAALALFAWDVSRSPRPPWTSRTGGWRFR
jgi:hypothetical protein